MLWDFTGELSDALFEEIASLAEAMPPDVAELRDDEQLAALQHRAQRLLLARVLPVDRTGPVLLRVHRAGVGYRWPLV